MKSLYTYINESEELLYHFTNGRNLVNILKADKFIGCEGDSMSPNYKYYMSTTRQPYAGTGYPTGMFERDICKIVLDVRKLNSKYKIMPVTWFKGSKNLAIRDNDPHWDEYKEDRMKQTNTESEDRVCFNTPTIPHFNKYIKAIVLDTNTIDPSDADDIIKYADKYGIDVLIAQTTKEFLTMR